jgi:hypothetical protein
VKPVGILAELLDRGQQRIEAEGLGVVSLDQRRRKSVRPSRHGDEREPTMASMSAHERGEPSAVQPWHVQIEEGQTGLEGVPEALHRVNPIDSGDHRAAESLETLGEPVSEVGVVIDQQDGTLARHKLMVVVARVERHRWGVGHVGA